MFSCALKASGESDEVCRPCNRGKRVHECLLHQSAGALYSFVVVLAERPVEKTRHSTKDVRSLSTAAQFLFATADKLAPCRQRLEKDQHWRAKEQELLALLS